MNAMAVCQKGVRVFVVLQTHVGSEECSRAQGIVAGAANFLQRIILHGVNSNTVTSARKSDAPKIPAVTEEFTKTEMIVVDLASHLHVLKTTA